jgi:hypothetical protein
MPLISANQARIQACLRGLRWFLWPTFVLSQEHLVHTVSFSWQPLDFALSLMLCLGHQCIGLSSDSFLSLASWFDAGSTLSQGWCSAYNQQHSLSVMHINA